ncbi:phage tail protein [Budviciaceae bacterium CWB-B4]|uniref:Phage tail protein n=1 Tax=Limnobaculum xujianqingii TaxID=2738837 RepID=A0A9D7AIG4_9GAMM|nr:phage tail protein [Limnobaculum xujianqingii]MBK5073220.1 phage tail protein [Limnobaculum xujianqingii]MBK5176529.1 phage tail protein [Limnobaculum xujianqingii]
MMAFVGSGSGSSLLDVGQAAISTGVKLLSDYLNSLLYPIGAIGPVSFVVSADEVKTFESFNHHSTANFVDHEVAGGKPVSEFTGLGLDEINFSIVLVASTGVVPLTELRALEALMAAGKPQRISIGPRNFGKFTIRAISDDWLHVTNKGAPLVISIQLTLVEYVASMPTQAQQIMRKDEIQRTETGKGGPERLPGTGTPTKPRTTTPKPSGGQKIDPVTRMPI